MDILNIVSLVAGGGVLVWVALAFLAPSVLTVAASWLSALSPLIKGISEWIVRYVNALWMGFKDMIDNVYSIVFVVTVAVVASLYTATPPRPKCPTVKPVAKGSVPCEKVIADLRRKYRFVPRKPGEKPPQAKPVTETPWWKRW